MRRSILLLATALVVLIGAGAANSAPRAVHLQNAIDLSVSVIDPVLSDICGFEATLTISGAYDVTLIYNEAGLVVREIDTTPAGTVTWSSAYGSTSFPMAQTSTATYPGGATIGSTANFTLNGLFTKVPGIPPEAGIQIVTDAIVVEFTPEGVPITVATGSSTITDHGIRQEGNALVSAICAAISP
jgi:hypothetical protein